MNDHFLREVVFPAFKLGVIDAAPAIEHLLRHLNDEHTRIGLDLLLERGVEGSFFGLTDEKWTEACYRLLFVEWLRDSEGWSIVSEYNAFAGEWESTLHLALMLEDPTYPYADAVRSRAYREAFFEAPRHKFGLASMICGVWDPVPDFPPDQILTSHGHGDYQPSAGIARADWSWRPIHAVNQWAAQLPNALSRLLQREAGQFSRRRGSGPRIRKPTSLLEGLQQLLTDIEVVRKRVEILRSMVLQTPRCTSIGDKLVVLSEALTLLVECKEVREQLESGD